MLEQQLLQSVPGLELLGVITADQQLTFELAATAATAACPLCGQHSARIHSRYLRHPADLPWADAIVQYLLHVRRFFCDNPDCKRRIFAERFGAALRAYARRTMLLATRLQQFGLAVGGAGGAAIAYLNSMPTSPSTILRLVRTAQLPAAPTPRVLSIDDFAFRKGHTYGTILVDLERHCPIELLPDRETQTVANWLREHPGVEIISRDRASAYGQAASEGAPHAVQVADRFHLYCNLGDALQRLLDRQSAALHEVTEQLAQLAAAALDPAATDPPQNTALGTQVIQAPVLTTASSQPQYAITVPAEAPQLAYSVQQAQRPAADTSLVAASTPGVSPAVQRRFAAIKQLQAQGCSQREIGRQLSLDRRTVRRYIVADQPPVRAYGRHCQPRAGAYLPYLRQRWSEGCHNAIILWKELQAVGYQGGYLSIYRLLTRRIGQPSGNDSSPGIASRQSRRRLVHRCR